MTSEPTPSFVPEAFPCDEHGQDLTEAVKQQVLSDPTVVASFGFSRRTGQPTGSQRFRVVVQCPGKSADRGTGPVRRPAMALRRQMQRLAGVDAGTHPVQFDGVVKP